MEDDELDGDKVVLYVSVNIFKLLLLLIKRSFPACAIMEPRGNTKS